MITYNIMNILQKARFKNTVKKLPKPLQQSILDAVEDILADPKGGELKTGDLEGFWVYKFKANRQLFLLAYRLEGDSIVLFQVGHHENFYRNLKRYIKETEG